MVSESRYKRWLTVLASVLLAQPLAGQYGTGMILGTITDPTKAVIPGIIVTAKNQATGAIRTFTTGRDGDYQLTPLPAGTYTVSAQSKAFKTATVPDVVVSVGSQTRIDIVMELGAGRGPIAANQHGSGRDRGGHPDRAGTAAQCAQFLRPGRAHAGIDQGGQRQQCYG